jgi:hypothetical protein
LYLLVVLVTGSLFAVTNAWARCPFLSAFRTRSDCTVRHSGWWVGSLRANVQLDPKLGSASTVDYHDAAGVDTASVHEVILGAVRTSKALAFARTVTNDVTRRTSVGLQSGREVVKSGLFIVELDVAVLVNLFAV